MLPPSFTDGHIKAISGYGTRDLAQVNHYSIKSAGEFLLKVDRGDAVNADRLGNSLQYWEHANRTGALDQSFTNLSTRAQTILDEFLSDSLLKELHEEAFYLREQRLMEVLKTAQGASLARSIGYFD